MSQRRPLLEKLVWMPVLVLGFAIVALWVVDPKTVYESQFLLIWLNFVFSTLASILVVVLLSRSFLSRGAPGMLLLSCGVLFWGSAGTVAPVLLSHGANVVISIQNILVWLSALCNLAGAVFFMKSNRGMNRPGWAMTAAYAAVAAVVWLAVLLVLRGRLPVFFIQGQGGTLLRQFILGFSVLLFAGTAGLLWTAHRRAMPPFIRWYGPALLLVATGLFGVMIQSVHGGILNWAASAAQLLGGAYMFVAAIATLRESHGREICQEADGKDWLRDKFLASFRKNMFGGWLLRYGCAVAAVAIAFALREALTTLFGPGLPPYITLYPAVMTLALLAGSGPGFLATVLAAGIVGYWILPPDGQFVIVSSVDRLGMAIFIAMGLFMSVVAELYRRNREKAAAYDREEVIRQIQKEKEFLADLLKYSEQPFGVGYPDGRLGLINHAFEQLTGYTDEELRSLDWATALTPPEWREVEKRKLDELNRTSQPVRYEKEYIRKDGSRVPIELLVHLKRDPWNKPEYYYSFLTDITGRKRAEEVFRENEDRLNFALGTIHTGAWDLDLMDHTAHRTLDHDRIFGYETLLSQWTYPMFLEHVLPEDRGEVDRKFQEAVKTRGDWNFECRIRRKDGEIRWILAAGCHRKDKSGQFRKMAGIIQDITARKQAEDAVRASEERLQQALLVSRSFTFEWYPATDTVLRSASCGKILGLTGGEAVSDTGQNYFQRVHPDDRVRFTQMLHALTPDASSYTVEYRVVRGDNDIVVLEEIGRASFNQDGKLERLVGVATDITKRKQAEDAFRLSEERFRSAQEAAEVGVWDWDISAGKLEWSFQMAVLFGMEPEKTEASFDAWRKVLHPDDLKIAEERVMQALEEHIPLKNEYRVVLPNKEIRWISAIGNTVYDPQGKALRMSGVCMDITERKNVEETLRRINIELRAANETLRASRLAALNLSEDAIQARRQAEQAEEELRKKSEDLDQAQAVGQVGSWRLDTGRNILTWSAENYRIFGVPEGTPLTYETFLNAIHPEDRQYVDARWRAALTGEPYDLEHRIVVDGQVKWVREKAYLELDNEGKLVGGFGITQDITERRKYEDELKKLNRILKAMSASSQAMGRVTDEMEYLKEVCRIIAEECGHSLIWVGYAEQDAGKTVRPVAFCGFDQEYIDSLNVTWADTERGRGPTGTAIRTGKVQLCRDIENDPNFAPWKPKALELGFHSSLVLPLDANLGVMGALNIYAKAPDAFSAEEINLLSDMASDLAYGVSMIRLRDLRNQAEAVLKRDKETFERLVVERTEELWDAQLKLAQSKRLSDIGALAATVAHELRTPLGVIRIGAYNMKRKTTEAALLKHISHIETKVVEADKIISNLLLYSRIKMPVMEEVRLYDLLKECADVAKENIKGRSISILEQFEAIQNESLKLDPLQIKEVFHNILANAADALEKHEKGEIRIRACRQDPKGEITVAFEDNGPGISESDLKRIHEPFFTTKSKGTGLGLTVCFQIIQNHNGRIEVTSQEGKGAVFTVVLPCGETVAG